MTKDKINMEQTQEKEAILYYVMLHYMQMKLRVLLLVIANKVSGDVIY
jgi:hypothetical protein